MPHVRAVWHHCGHETCGSHPPWCRCCDGGLADARAVEYPHVGAELQKQHCHDASVVWVRVGGQDLPWAVCGVEDLVVRRRTPAQVPW